MSDNETQTATPTQPEADGLKLLTDGIEAVFQGLAFAVSLPFVYWGLWTKVVTTPTETVEEISCPYCRGTDVMEIPDASAQFGRILYTCCNGRCLEEFRS